MCYYFDSIIEIKDFGNILLDEKPYENILIYDILYKTFICVKHLWILFDKLDWFCRDYDKTKYLVSFGLEIYDGIYDRIRYPIGLKSGIFHVFSL